jgi:hypothetical protein
MTRFPAALFRGALPGAFALMATSTALAAWPEWTTFQGNAAHTGYVPATLDPSRISQRWQIPVQTMQGDFGVGIACVAVSHGQVFVSGGTKLQVFNESDGSATWSHDFGDLEFPSVNPPAVSEGVVYVAAGQQESTTMFALDAVTGAMVFRSAMTSQWENYLAPTLGAHGVYTNAGTYGGLYAFKRNGRERFFDSNEEQQSVWTPAVDATGVYSYTGFLEVVDPVTGHVLHHIDDGTFENYVYEIGGSPVLGAPGSVIVANYANAQLVGNTLLDFSTATDSIAWKVKGAYPTTPAYHAGVIYATNNNPLQLEVRSETDGSMAWHWTPAGSDTGFVSEVLLTDSLVFVSTDAATYAISLATHQMVWSSKLTGKVALSKAGVLYIQGQSTLTAFDVR